MPYPDAAGRAAAASRSDRVETIRAGRFPRALRLTARAQFLDVYERGRRVSSPEWALFGIRNDLDHPRLGMTVGRKYGNAAERNRIKRRLREIFRRRRKDIPVPIDVVVNVRDGAALLPFPALEASFVKKLLELARKLEP